MKSFYVGFIINGFICAYYDYKKYKKEIKKIVSI